MIHFFRSIINSKIGMVITFAFLVLIALAFAGSDITGTGAFGGVTGSSNAVTVGKEGIGTGEVSRSATNAVNSMRQQNPGMTMAGFVDEGGLDKVVDDMAGRRAIALFADKHGLAVSKRLIDSEILQIDAFKGPDGNFSQDVFRQVLGNQGLNEAGVRDDFHRGLLAQQALVPVTFGATVPSQVAKPYASLLLERRSGQIGFLPSEAFAAGVKPTDKAIADFYRDNARRYTLPERRIIRYATFDNKAVPAVAPPTEAEIAAEYKSRAAEFSASEKRSFTQLVVPTKAAADALLTKIRGGASLDQAAKDVGLATSQQALATKKDIAASIGPKVADAAFATASGQTAAPAQSPLGWHVIRVDGIDKANARTLDQVRGLLTAQLTEKKQVQAFADLAARIEEQVDGGASLDEIAKDMKLTITSTPALLANGKAPAQPAFALPAELQQMLGAAFAMEEENEPQLGSIAEGMRYAIYDVSDIEPAAPAPLAKIKDRVTADLIRAQGSTKAKAAADKVVAAFAKGADLVAALSGLKMQLPAPETVNRSRAELTANNQRVAPPLALMFSMAEKSAKRLDAGNDLGWFIVVLNDIIPGVVADDDPVLAQVRGDLKQVFAAEYEQQFRRAIEAEVPVKRNEDAIRKLGNQLAGRS